jgi:hypothetical protein
MRSPDKPGGNPHQKNKADQTGANNHARWRPRGLLELLVETHGIGRGDSADAGRQEAG